MPKGVRAKKGDTRTLPNGRVMVKCVEHPVFGDRFVLRSHFVWWRYRRQTIPTGMHLHHVDEDKGNDSLRNLELLTNSAHIALHMNTPAKKALLRKQAKRQHAEGKLGSSTWTEEGKEKLRKTASESATRRHRSKEFGSSTWTAKGKESLRKASSNRAVKMHKENRFGIHAWKEDPSAWAKRRTAEGKFGHATWTAATSKLVSANTTKQHKKNRKAV